MAVVKIKVSVDDLDLTEGELAYLCSRANMTMLKGSVWEWLNSWITAYKLRDATTEGEIQEVDKFYNWVMSQPTGS